MTPDETTRRKLQALDAYLAALVSMPNAVGRAVRAMELAEAQGLPPLELVLVGDTIRSHEDGETQAAWVERHAHLADSATLPDTPHPEAPNRLAQAIATLVDAGLWPWHH